MSVNFKTINVDESIADDFFFFAESHSVVVAAHKAAIDDWMTVARQRRLRKPPNAGR
jgi:exoribonuclease II